VPPNIESDNLCSLNTRRATEGLKSLVYNAGSMTRQSKTNSIRVEKARIAELLAPFIGPVPLADSQLDAIQAYIDLLLLWNAKLNLTAIRDPEEIVIRHFGESLFAARQLFPAADPHSTAIDVGSGAGFPGLPLKLWCPSLNLTLIESNQRKATFLREVVRTLNLNSVSILSERAERISLRADLVTFRAVEHFERILSIAFNLVKPGGRIAALIGGAQSGLAQSVLPNIRWEDPIPIPLSRNGMLLIGEIRSE
jgi:16S rRNA (guanine527-N7)-methyltransferase